MQVIIEDSGPGIPEEWRYKVFEPFFTTKGADQQHLGMGLAIAQGIVARHGGRSTSFICLSGRLPHARAAALRAGGSMMTPQRDDWDELQHELLETELETLYQVSQVLSRSLDLKETLSAVLRALHDGVGLERGMVSLIEPETGALLVTVAYGLERNLHR